MASFFEKLTGASDNEQEKKPQAESSLNKTDIKKESIKSFKIKKPKTNKKVMKKNIKKNKEDLEEKSSFAPIDAETSENKDWLEEPETEEGQLTIDVYQTESDIIIKSTIAGVDPENIDISITNDIVTIRGKRMKDEKVEAENYYYQELYWGFFSRSVILPAEVDIDKIKASIKNGILTVKLPKMEKTKTKKIQVKALE